MELDLGDGRAGRGLRGRRARASARSPRRRGSAFEIESTTALPASIVTDEQRLQQVLRNLLSNAFKFTDEGTVAAVEPSAATDRRARQDADRVRRRATRASASPTDKLRRSSRPSSRPTARRAAQVRRDGPGPVDQPRDLAPARRRDPRDVARSGEGSTLHAAAAAGPPRPADGAQSRGRRSSRALGARARAERPSGGRAALLPSSASRTTARRSGRGPRAARRRAGRRPRAGRAGRSRASTGSRASSPGARRRRWRCAPSTRPTRCIVFAWRRARRALLAQLQAPPRDAPRPVVVAVGAAGGRHAALRAGAADVQPRPGRVDGRRSTAALDALERLERARRKRAARRRGRRRGWTREHRSSCSARRRRRRPASRRARRRSTALAARRASTAPCWTSSCRE